MRLEKIFNDAVREFICDRQDSTGEDFERALVAAGMRKQYYAEQSLRDYYYETLERLLPHNRRELIGYTDSQNGIEAIRCEVEYRRGFMDAFRIFRKLCRVDDWITKSR